VMIWLLPNNPVGGHDFQRIGNTQDSAAIEFWLLPNTVIVDSLHLSTLIAAYHKYFSEYSNGRKHATKHVIPAKVWVLVYEDYKEAHPASALD
jgi:hypothetical protein